LKIPVLLMVQDILDKLGGRAIAVGLMAASAAVLASAYGFQFIGGLQPCPLCLYQRVPWWVALGLAALALRLHRSPRARDGAVLLGAAAVLVGAGIAGYHAGVEYKWWTGPTACSGVGGTAQSLDALRAQIMSAAVVRCDETPWSLFGVSMAGYNFLLSLFVGLGAGWAVWMTRR
jgi:disulfide bond formation protein DsbB